MTEQEHLWAGEFGNAYTQRNRVAWEKRVPFWRSIVEATQAHSALEIGCNAGWNLHALSVCGIPTLAGIDINHGALQEARNAGFQVLHGGPSICDSMCNKFDLVFTVGVLIHIAPDHLEQAMASIVNVSSRYVLAVEYDAEHETEVKYRGMKDALWKRPYGQLYRNLGLKTRRVGMLTEVDGFDNCVWWLMEKK